MMKCDLYTKGFEPVFIYIAKTYVKDSKGIK